MTKVKIKSDTGKKNYSIVALLGAIQIIAMTSFIVSEAKQSVFLAIYSKLYPVKCLLHQFSVYNDVKNQIPHSQRHETSFPDSRMLPYNDVKIQKAKNKVIIFRPCRRDASRLHNANGKNDLKEAPCPNSG